MEEYVSMIQTHLKLCIQLEGQMQGVFIQSNCKWNKAKTYPRENFKGIEDSCYFGIKKSVMPGASFVGSVWCHIFSRHKIGDFSNLLRL